MDIKYLSVPWQCYHNLTRKLAASILAATRSQAVKIDQIVAISRGGLTLGHLLSDFLRVPISTIAVQSYTNIQTQGELKITEGRKTQIKGQHILVVDDVSDSGQTLRRAIGYLKLAKPKEITTVTMFYKPRSVFRPDFFAKKTTSWILFPYETTEMILLLTQRLTKEGKNKAEIQHFLESLGFSDEQIGFVRKYHLE